MSAKRLIDYKILGKNIRDARERLGKTQSEVADDLQIAVSSYGKFELGILRPNPEKLIAICNVLCVGMKDILRGALIIPIETSNSVPH